MERKVTQLKKNYEMNEYDKMKLDKYSSNKESWQLLIEYYKDKKIYTREEEQTVFRKYRENPTRELRNEIIAHNIKLVVSFAGKYSVVSSDIKMDDLVQEGVFGLITAIEKFDPDTDNKFSTYASWWIMQAMLRYIENHDGAIRIPVHARDLYVKYKRYLRERETDSLPAPTDDELRHELKITDGEVNIIRMIEQRRTVSLNTPVGEEEDTELEYSVEDPNALASYKEIERQALREKIEELLQKYLSRISKKETRDRQAAIIRMRLGLDGTGEPKTLEVTGQSFGITRERVRQIECNFIKFLKKPQNRKVLRDFYYE